MLGAVNESFVALGEINKPCVINKKAINNLIDRAVLDALVTIPPDAFHQFSLFQFDRSDDDTDSQGSEQYSTEQETPDEEKFQPALPEEQVTGKRRTKSKKQGQKNASTGNEKAPAKANLSAHEVTGEDLQREGASAFRVNLGFIDENNKEEPNKVTIEINTSFQETYDALLDSETETEEREIGAESVSQEGNVNIQDKGRVIKITSEEDDVDITMSDPRVTKALGPQR